MMSLKNATTGERARMQAQQQEALDQVPSKGAEQEAQAIDL